MLPRARRTTPRRPIAGKEELRAERSSPPPKPFEEEILTRLAALNHKRAVEEKRGLVRWLQPDYQCPAAASAPAEEQAEIDLPPAEISGALRPVSAALVPELGSDPAALSARFGRANKKRDEQIEGILETLRGLGL